MAIIKLTGIIITREPLYLSIRVNHKPQVQRVPYQLPSSIF